MAAGSSVLLHALDHSRSISRPRFSVVKTARDRRAVDRADNRTRKTPQRGDGIGRFSGLQRRCEVSRRAKLFEVEAGAECFAGASHDQDPHAGVALQTVDRRDELLPHSERQGSREPLMAPSGFGLI